MDKPNNFIDDIIKSDLDEGRENHVHTRFPPEPNGYLHIGSAKAIWINYMASKTYNGKFNLRYDDTNPLKEDDEYVKAIEEDLIWLGAKPNGGIYYGSDYFDKCYEFALELIKKGKAYVCELGQDEMREYRGSLTEPGKNSPWRERSAEESLELFEKMKNGEFKDGEMTVRAKIDMSSPNMNMRDPVIYRILHAAHHRQKDKWCIYPMYDFAHPIQDALEGITHSLCSIEFENHRPLYNWVIDNLEFKEKPHQYEFARLNMTYTVMSKRYLRRLVETKTVESWDDPRMPTLSGLRRRGYTPTAIFDFIERSGVAKANSMADIHLLEYCICEELNQTAERRVAVIEPIPVTITNYPDGKVEYFDFPNNPKNKELGYRKLPFTNKILIEKSDFMKEPVPGFIRLIPGGEVRLMGAYIMRCDEVVSDSDGNVVELKCSVDIETGCNKPLDGRKVKGTVHWISAEHAIEKDVWLCENLFTAENVATLLEEENFDSFINKESLKVLKTCKLEQSLQNAGSSKPYQFVRLGYFIQDSKNADVFIRTSPLKSGYKPE